MAKPREDRQRDLLRPALEEVIDLGYPLVRLAREIDWQFLDGRFASVCTPGPAQVMVYDAIALALYRGSSTREVLRCLLEGVRWLWGAEAVKAFEDGCWGQKDPAISQSWRRAWAEVVPFDAFPSDVRRILYTTNAIEALNSKLRQAVRARGQFPSDEVATKRLFLVLNRAEKEWIMPPRE